MERDNHCSTVSQHTLCFKHKRGKHERSERNYTLDEASQCGSPAEESRNGVDASGELQKPGQFESRSGYFRGAFILWIVQLTPHNANEQGLQEANTVSGKVSLSV